MSDPFAVWSFIALSAGTGAVVGFLAWRGGARAGGAIFSAIRVAAVPFMLFIVTMSGVLFVGTLASEMITTRGDAAQLTYLQGWGPLLCVALTWLWLGAHLRT